MIGSFPLVMELGSLTVTAPLALQRRRLSMGLRVEEGSVFRCVLVLACAIFCLATCKPCLLNSMQQSMANDACGPCVDDRIDGSEDTVAVDTSFELAAGGSMPDISAESICANPHLLCFPSTLTGSLPGGSTQDSRWGNSTWPSGMGVFRLLNGRTVSCSLNSREGSAKLVNFGENFEQSVEVFGHDHASLSRCPRHTDKQTGILTKKNYGMKKSPPVDVHLPVLDWGEKHIYSVSLAFLTVANTCNKSILTVYEPFSSDSQFYPCNSIGVSLGPGEVASLCFVFTPRSLGFMSSQVMLQTSSGGFFIEVKGLAVKSPYNISPLVTSLFPDNGRASERLSFLNPYNENLHVKEVSAWMLASRGKISHQTEATCWLENFKDPDGNSPLADLGDWLIVDNSEADYPLMAIRPRENWVVGAHHTETIVEIDFSYDFQGQMLGSFCIQLLRPSLNMSDTIIVPVEIVLENWKSRGSSSMFVLDMDEISFPKVQVGAPFYRWISVKNPSEEPVVMQLILNSGEIVDECSADDDSLQPSETGNSFSVEDGAATEAYVHPRGIASLGPIVFHPTRQCRWRSSALVRNNLYGVEWISLTGFGGSFNLVIFEGWKSVLWVQLRKSAGAFLLAAFFILLVIFYVSPQVMDYAYQEHSHNDDKTSPDAVQGTGKTFHMSRDRSRSKLSASPSSDSLLSSSGKDKSSKDGKHPKSRVPVQNVTPSHKNQDQFVLNGEQAASVLLAEIPETLSASAPQPCNLTIRIGKEKGRRRRKRRGLNGGLNALDVSSSHSGNSTPSSPMSPLASSTPSSSRSPIPDIDRSEARSPFGRAVESKAKASASHRMDESLSASEGFTSASRNTNGKPVLLPSASTLAPYARAPGSKLWNRKAVSVEAKVGDEYRYDIWGDHFSGLNVTGRSNDAPTVKAAVTKSDFNSFFVRGPQALVGGKSQPKYVSCFRAEG